MLPDSLLSAKNLAKEQLLGIRLPEQVARRAAPTIGEAGDSAPNPNILGVGIGAKLTMGRLSMPGQEVIRIYVKVKVPARDLPPSERVPSEFEGVPTDVIEAGDVRATQSSKSWQRFSRLRPACGGVSAAHPHANAGTLGCLVQDQQGRVFILSNNHILANENEAALDDPILQPAPMDGGSLPGDEIARLFAFKPLQFFSSTDAARMVQNDIDAAIALVDTRWVEPVIIDIGRPKDSTRQAVQYLSVRKHGRTTGHTVGIVEDISADIRIQYRAGKQAWFEDQIVVRGAGTRDFARVGDSGSLVVDAVTLEPVGLLFAVGNDLAYLNPIDRVLSYFGVKIVG